MGFTYRKYPPEFLTSIKGKSDRLYMVWYDMHKRCKAGSRDAALYYDRGIRVCEEWGYWPTFATWARNNGYANVLEIDRKNNDLGYFPDNCRFSNELIQARNKDHERDRLSRIKAQRKRAYRPFICMETGEIFTAHAEAAEIKKVDRSTLQNVLSKNRGRCGGFHWQYLNPEAPHKDAAA